MADYAYTLTRSEGGQTLERQFNPRGIDYCGIPQELKGRPQWAVWKYVERPGKEKPAKIAFQARYTNRRASSDNPEEHWTSFEKARTVYEESGRFDGLCFLLTAEDPYIGLDYDECRNPQDGEMHTAVRRGLEEIVGGYVEVSPSGTGIKAIVRGEKPGKRCSTKKTPWGDEFAIYSERRYFCLTGRALEGRGTITEEQAALDTLYERHFGKEETPSGSASGGLPSVADHGLSNDELLRRASNFENGNRFDALFHRGDISGYDGDHSRADYALMDHWLCFLTSGDVERMVAMFEQSALYRPSPEKDRGYVKRTAMKAANTHQSGYYEPGPPPEAQRLIWELSEVWYGREPKGVGPLNEMRFVRFLIHKGEKVGEALEDGLRVEASTREAAEALGGSRPNTVSSIVNRLRSKGVIRLDNRPGHTRNQPNGYVLLSPPRATRYNSTNTVGVNKTCLLGVVSPSARPPVSGLLTRHHHLRDGVGYAGEHLRCRVEAEGGSRTAEEWNEVFGYSRVRDLRRRLDSQVEAGLMERADGRYGLPGAYEKRQREFWESKPISTLQKRSVREKSVEGIPVRVVKETGTVATGAERVRLARARHEREREGFRESQRRFREAEHRRPEEDAEIIGFLNAWDDERSESRREARCAYHDGMVVNTKTGEVVREVHAPDCECPACLWRAMRNRAEGAA